MSHSVPSESSAIDATFIVGAELVEFDRRELPIYQLPQTRWAEACVDEASYGASLDRVFGEPGDIHVDGIAIGAEDPQAITAVVADDALVSLAALSDGLILPGTEPSAAPELATVFDFGADAHAIVHLGGNVGWDATGTDGTFDFLA